MKILYFTDPHIKGKSPVHRTDNFYDSIMAKVAEVFKIAYEENCAAVLCGGDMFDSPTVSLRVADDLVDLIEGEYGNVDLHTVVGNHDMLNCNWSVSDATVIAHLIRMDKIKLLDKRYQLDKKLHIDGYNYAYDIEDQLRKGLLMRELNPESFNIAVVHAMIVANDNPFKCINLEQIPCNYDMVLCSHSHVPFGIKTFGKTTYVSPGALARLTIEEKDCKRTPQCAIIDTETREVKLVPLTSAKPYEEVFDLSKIAEQKENAKKLDLFVSALKSAKIQSLSVATVLEEVCKASNVDDETKDLILRKIYAN